MRLFCHECRIIVYDGPGRSIVYNTACMMIRIVTKNIFYGIPERSSLNRQYNKRELLHTGHRDVDDTCCSIHLVGRGKRSVSVARDFSHVLKTEKVTTCGNCRSCRNGRR